MPDALDFEEVYARYFDRVRTYLSRTVGSEDGADLAQDVFIKIHSALGTFDGASSLYTWVYRIATNHLIDTYRKRSAIVDRCNISDRALFCKPDSRYLTAELEIIRDEMKECVCSYIKRLPPNYRAVLVLREYEGLSIVEIAQILGKSAESTKKTMSRARARLRKTLQDQCLLYYDEENKLFCEKKAT